MKAVISAASYKLLFLIIDPPYDMQKKRTRKTGSDDADSKRQTIFESVILCHFLTTFMEYMNEDNVKKPVMFLVIEQYLPLLYCNYLLSAYVQIFHKLFVNQ